MSEDELRSADGTRLVVRREGAGEPVVLLHGSGGGLHSWGPVADRLADSFELWMPARRGYGPSDVPAGVKTFADEVADVAAVVDAAGRPVHLVGASYGAIVALHAAVARPEGVRSAAVFEPPFFACGPHVVPLLERYRTAFERDDAAAMFAVLNEVTRVPAAIVAALTAGAGERRADPAGDRRADPAGERRADPAGERRADPAGERRADPAEERRSAVGWLHDLEALAADDGADFGRWAAVRAPVLVMQGAETWAPMPATMDALAAAIPGARRTVWAGQTHFAPSVAPELVVGALREFFATAA